MRTHVTIIAWLNIIHGALGLLGGLGLFLFFTVLGGAAAASGGHDGIVALPFLGGIGVFVFMIFAVFCLPGLLLGWGLLNYAPWARIFGIVISIYHILLGIGTLGISTLIGIYTLVILFNSETVALFEKPNYRVG